MNDRYLVLNHRAMVLAELASDAARIVLAGAENAGTGDRLRLQRTINSLRGDVAETIMPQIVFVTRCDDGGAVR